MGPSSSLYLNSQEALSAWAVTLPNTLYTKNLTMSNKKKQLWYNINLKILKIFNFNFFKFQKSFEKF